MNLQASDSGRSICIYFFGLLNLNLNPMDPPKTIRNGLAGCCNFALEGAQQRVHQEWKKRLGWLIVGLRCLAKLVGPALCGLSSWLARILPATGFVPCLGEYAAGMAMRRLTRIFDYAGAAVSPVDLVVQNSVEDE